MQAAVAVAAEANAQEKESRLSPVAQPEIAVASAAVECAADRVRGTEFSPVRLRLPGSAATRAIRQRRQLRPAAESLQQRQRQLDAAAVVEAKAAGSRRVRVKSVAESEKGRSGRSGSVSNPRASGFAEMGRVASSILRITDLPTDR